jgi:hypothetical protein
LSHDKTIDANKKKKTQISYFDYHTTKNVNQTLNVGLNFTNGNNYPKKMLQHALSFSLLIDLLYITHTIINIFIRTTIENKSLKSILFIQKN